MCKKETALLVGALVAIGAYLAIKHPRETGAFLKALKAIKKDGN